MFGYGNTPFSKKKKNLTKKKNTESFRIEDKGKGIYWAIYFQLTSQIKKKNITNKYLKTKKKK